MTGSTGAASNEFVELVNAGTSAADVGGFKVAYRSSAGTSDITLVTIPAGTNISAGGLYLLGGDGFPGARDGAHSLPRPLAPPTGSDRRPPAAGRGLAHLRPR